MKKFENFLQFSQKQTLEPDSVSELLSYLFVNFFQAAVLILVNHEAKLIPVCVTRYQGERFLQDILFNSCILMPPGCDV